MIHFEWDDVFKTSLEPIDAQHKKLIAIINSLGSVIASYKTSEGTDFNLSEIEVLFQELKDYTRYHFKEEASLMKEFGVDKRHVKDHLKKHRDFVAEISALSERIQDRLIAPSYLFEFLTNWMVFHILGTDKNMAKQIKAIQAGATPEEAYQEDVVEGATRPLLKSLNALFEQVHIHNKELIRLNDSLEQKVLARTQQLEEYAYTDMLTGIFNRRHAMFVIGTIWRSSRLSNSPLSCLMVDADHFKEVNDIYGHNVGDEVLKQLALTLQASSDEEDIVCRLGGDEFLIICPDTTLEKVVIKAEQLLKNVNMMNVVTGDSYWQGSVSIGVATSTEEMLDHNALIKMADTGVYEAKRSGKNCIRMSPMAPIL